LEESRGTVSGQLFKLGYLHPETSRRPEGEPIQQPVPPSVIPALTYPEDTTDQDQEPEPPQMPWSNVPPEQVIQAGDQPDLSQQYLSAPQPTIPQTVPGRGPTSISPAPQLVFPDLGTNTIHPTTPQQNLDHKLDTSTQVMTVGAGRSYCLNMPWDKNDSCKKAG
jgi:hypothetical protein